MKIGIIGTGNMGRALGVRWARASHVVMFGARRPEAAQEAVERAGNGASAGTISEAARFGETLLWTLREPDIARILDDPATLDGKVIVDLNNRDYATEASKGEVFGTSIAERLQASAPKARVVKAFNMLAMESFDIPRESLREAGAQIFIAGDDAKAKAAVNTLAADIGFTTVDAGSGPIAMRTVEAMGDVIRLLMIAGGHGGQAHLRLVTLPKPSLDLVGARLSSNYH